MQSIEIPLQDYVSLINNELTEQESAIAKMIPTDIEESIKSQITPEELEQYAKLIPIIYGNEGQQPTTEQTESNSGTSESLPESKELRSVENAEREVQQEEIATPEMSQIDQPVGSHIKNNSTNFEQDETNKAYGARKHKRAVIEKTVRVVD